MDTTERTAEGTSEFALVASAIGAVGYLLTILLPDDATGFWGFVCDVFTLWGWGGWTSLVLAGLFGALLLVRRLSAGFTRAPRWRRSAAGGKPEKSTKSRIMCD